MLQQSHGDHQRHQPFTVLRYQFMHFALFSLPQRAFEVPSHMFEDITVSTATGSGTQAGHQQFTVTCGDILRAGLIEPGNQAAHGPIKVELVGHQQVLVARMELDE